MDTQFLQQVINAISLGAIYAMFALGYALVFSVMGVLNLAHSAIFTSGAIFGLIAIQFEFPVRQIPFGSASFFEFIPIWGAQYPKIPVWAAFLLAMLLSGILGILLERIAFMPLRRRNAPRISQLISSIGVALIFVNLAELYFNSVYQRTEEYFPRDLTQSAPILIGGSLSIQPIRLVILAVALTLMILLQFVVTRTRTGRAMRTVAFNQRVAGLLGVDSNRIFMLTFFIAGALGGAGGMLFGLTFGRVTPYLGQDIALIGLVAIVLGGMGSINGAVLGGFIVAALQVFTITFIDSSYRDAIVFLLFILMLLVRPQGLLGQPQQNRA